MDRKGKKSRSVVKAIWFDLQNVGKRWKSSKQRYTWKIQIDGKEHQIDLFVSKMSLKYRIVVDGNRIQMSKSIGGMFQYPFELDRHMLNIIQEQNNQYKLRIDSQDFQQIYMAQQMGDQYPEEEQQDQQVEQLPQIKQDPYVQSNQKQTTNDYYYRNQFDLAYDLSQIDETQYKFESNYAKSQAAKKSNQQAQQPTQQPTIKQPMQNNQNKQDLFADRQEISRVAIQENPTYQTQTYQEPQRSQQQQQQQILIQEQKQQKNLQSDLVGLWDSPQSNNTQQQIQNQLSQFPQNQSNLTYQQQANPTPVPVVQNVQSQNNPSQEQLSFLPKQNQQFQQLYMSNQQNQPNDQFGFTQPSQERQSQLGQQPQQSSSQQNVASDFDLLGFSGQSSNQQSMQNQQPQKKQEDKSKELDLLCNLDNLEKEDESPANMKKKQQASKPVTIIPGNVPMKQLPGQTQSTQSSNMQGMQQMNNMQQQQMYQSMMQQMMMSNNMNMMNQMNPMMMQNNMNMNQMNPMMMQMFNTMMGQMNQGGMNFQSGGQFPGAGGYGFK